MGIKVMVVEKCPQVLHKSLYVSTECAQQQRVKPKYLRRGYNDEEKEATHSLDHVQE